MNIVSIADAKARLSAYIRESKETGPVIITRNGRPAAILLPVLDEDDIERLLLAYNPKFRQLIEAAEQRIEETGGIPHEEFWQSVEEMGVSSS
ncbi:MAG: type II toxin-antitoxin system Phd/YefM family antitoxin [Chloroflexi bacterium]|nr:MAG: type II toxin-antitoxin system Phd/YefM family antitoxin [Chloroflexota bacterium]